MSKSLWRAGAIGCLQKKRRSLRREREYLRPPALGAAPHSSPAVQSVTRHDPDGPFEVRVSIPVEIASLGQPDLRAPRPREKQQMQDHGEIVGRVETVRAKPREDKPKLAIPKDAIARLD